MESADYNKSVPKKIISKYDLDFQPVFRDLRDLEKHFKGFDTTLKNFDIDLNYIHEIEGFTQKKNKIHHSGHYKQNLYKLECTCEVFSKNKTVFNKKDLRRLCKHLYWKLSNLKLVDKLTLLLAFDSVYFNYKKMIKLSYGKDFVIASYKEGSSWINIFSKEKEWKKFSYEINQKRWSYNSKPANSNRIKQDINYLFSNILFVKGINY